MAEPTEDQIYIAKLDAEIEKWSVLGINPQGWAPTRGFFDGLALVDVLAELLVEKGIATEDEIETAFRKQLLFRLESIRKEAEPQIQAARREAIKNGQLRRH